MQGIQGQNEGRLCAPWAPPKGSHHPKIRSHPQLVHFRHHSHLFFFFSICCCCRKRRVSTNDEGLWKAAPTCEERRRDQGRKRRLICHLRCLAHMLASVHELPFSRAHLSEKISQTGTFLSCCMPPCLLICTTSAEAYIFTEVAPCLWKTGYPRPGTPTLPSSLGLSCWACWLLSCQLALSSSWGRREEKRCRKRKVLQDASGVNDSSHLAVVTCGSGSTLLPALLHSHCLGTEKKRARTSAVYFLHRPGLLGSALYDS